MHNSHIHLLGISSSALDVLIVRFITFPLGGVQSIVMSMSVCLSGRPYYLKTARPNFTKVFVHVACIHGSSSSDGIVIHYLLLAFQMTLCFYTVDPMGVQP